MKMADILPLARNLVAQTGHQISIEYYNTNMRLCFYRMTPSQRMDHMSNRITEKQLQTLCDHLNRITNSPMVTYSAGPDGPLKNKRLIAQIGNYHLSFAYGGVSLLRVCNESGACADVFGCGHTTKRDLQNRMCAYVDGIILQRGVQ